MPKDFGINQSLPLTKEEMIDTKILDLGFSISNKKEEKKKEKKLDLGNGH